MEDPRKSNDIPQCTRCQQYGHTKNNCMRPYRCVKCAEGHKTIDCPKKDRTTPATCTLCRGSHPANYKGCQIYKEIRARKIIQPTHRKNLPKPHMQYTKTDKAPPQMNEFPQLKPSKYTTTQPTSSHSKDPRNPGYWVKESEVNKSQPTNLLEQIILKQSEKIDVLIQQIDTYTTLIAQYK